MPKKSNVEIAFDEQVKQLSGTKAEMLKIDFGVWKWNYKRIHNIQNILDIGMTEGEPLDDKKRTSLDNEKHRLVNENIQLGKHINKTLDGTEVETDEFDAFMSR